MGRLVIPYNCPAYCIVRMSQNGGPVVKRRYLTRAEAQAWCQRDDTKGPGWFDGFDLMPLYRDAERRAKNGEPLTKRQIAGGCSVEAV